MSSPLNQLFVLVSIFVSFGFCSFNQPDFPPVYLTLSPLYREATHSTKLIDREVQIQWVNNSVDSIALYNTNPKDKSEPVLEFKTLLYPDGFVSTNIPFGDPEFPGGWEKESKDLPVSGDHCLPIWVLAYKDKNLIFSDCFKIRPTWMQDNRLSLENLELTSLFIPGTHNSGSYRRTDTPGQRDSSGRYIITQDQNLWQQLVYGVRYLDFRIGYYNLRKNGSETAEDDSSFWINHDLIKIRKLLPLLDDLKQFMKKTKEEIVILDLHRFPLGFTGRPFRHHQLVKLLERELKEYAVPYKKDYIPTLGSIWDQGKRIVISYGDNIVAQEYDWLWPPIRQLWGNKQTTEGLYNYLEKCMTNDSLRNPERGLWAAMAQLTPGPLDLLFNPKGSLRIMASQINRNLTEWCRERWWDRANILAMDFFLGTDTITTAVLSNVFKGSTAKHYVTN
ncbi:PI-PLC X domain-containing protein 1 [Halyomorpha halys]|uniref:PI-PLC X domain-containing protein 1 n=1 Tax=Halyomorpha halys TaxID=286706 RepID=UPI0006D4EC95|nr:PI-PLC X domain-containing protein 1 [Halyomorpha halys]